MPEIAQSRSVFISYRREDTGAEALNLFDALTRTYGNDAIFMDVDGIPYGVDFREYLKKNLSGCRVLLAVIGRSWLTSPDDHGNPRLNDANDFVRFEIATALAGEIDVIPVLVQGATIPQAAVLPEDLKSLTFRHGTKLSHDHWKSDTAQLISALKPYFPVPVSIDGARKKSRFKLVWTLSLSLCALLVVGVVAVNQFNQPTASPVDPNFSQNSDTNNANSANQPYTNTVNNPPANGMSKLSNGPVRVSGDIMSGYLISSPTPVYPDGAKPGSVTLHAIISRTGTVGNLSVVSGSDMLGSSALDAVRNWQYKPYLVSGNPVEVDTTIVVNFGISSLPNNYMPKK